MRLSALSACIVFATASFSLVGCAADTSVEDDELIAPLTSNEATFVDFELEGVVEAAKSADTAKAITSQMFFTIGGLTSFSANARVGFLKTSNVVVEDLAGGQMRVRYHATMPVAWPKKKTIPGTYPIVVPRNVDAGALSAFFDSYNGKCGTAEYGGENFWHDFQPQTAGCVLKEADISKSTASVKRSSSISRGKYPEYKQVWADKALKVVAIFGQAESGGPSDVGVQEYEAFISAAKTAVPGSTQTENKAPASLVRDVTVEGTITTRAGVQKVSVTSLLIGTLYEAGPEFDTRYDPLSADADLVVYNGHSELSKNTNALGRKGKVTKGQYQMFFFDSCDTFAYLDTALTDRRIVANGALDPKGSKYLDVVTNVLPSYFSNYSGSSMTFLDALLHPDTPKSFKEILAVLPSDQVVVVSGEEDNTFKP